MVSSKMASEMSGSMVDKSVSPMRSGMTITDVNGIYENTLISIVSGFVIPEMST